MNTRHTCGYPIRIKSLAYGQEQLTVFIDDGSDSSTFGRETPYCPRCGRRMHESDFHQSGSLQSDSQPHQGS